MDTTIESLKGTYQKVPSSVKTAVLVGGATLAAPYVFPIVLYPLGWTAAGVKTGTVASVWQSTMGGTIVKGSFFSLAQKTAAIGTLGALGVLV